MKNCLPKTSGLGVVQPWPVIFCTKLVVQIQQQQLGLTARGQDISARGQDIDCSATEAMLRTLEFLAIEYDQLGAVRTRSGNRSQYAAPGNVYRTGDGKWASIAAWSRQISNTRIRPAAESTWRSSWPRGTSW